jgi:hypothetical protein
MKTEITIMPVNDIMNMSKMFVESGMFTDAKSVAQAFVKIQAGQEIGLAPFAAMSGINVIMGKPTFGAGVIASSVKGSGKYDFKVKEMSDKTCSIDFFEGKEKIGNSTFTLEDAKKQGTKNLDKFPKNMLYARAMSNGQKWFCPDVFQMAVYVPEEMPEVTNDVPCEVIEPTKTIPTLNDKQLKKLLESDIETIEKYLNAIEEEQLKATAVQVLNLEDKLTELRKNG